MTEGKRPFSRRRFLTIAGLSILGTAASGTGAFTYASQIEPGMIEINPLSLHLPRLAAEFDAYRLVQISDIHMDHIWMDEARLKTIVALVNEQQADLVVMTGDFVTGGNLRIYGPSLVSALSQLSAPDGVMAVLGNHDYWTDAPGVRQAVHDAGMIDLSNTVRTLSRGEATLHIAGVDDIWEQKSRLDLVLAQLPATGAAILLAHEPDFADQSAASGRFDLQLSGHSHGGQVNVPLFGPPILPYLGQKYPRGLYQVGSMIQYTNRGLGMLKPMFRFNCRPEITVFTLRSS